MKKNEGFNQQQSIYTYSILNVGRLVQLPNTIFYKINCIVIHRIALRKSF